MLGGHFEERGAVALWVLELLPLKSAPRILELLPGFWFYEEYFKKGTLKPKIEKRALLPLFYCLCSDICRKKNIVFLRYLNNLMIFWYSAGSI